LDEDEDNTGGDQGPGDDSTMSVCDSQSTSPTISRKRARFSLVSSKRLPPPKDPLNRRSNRV
jgi:hypothetical protein